AVGAPPSNMDEVINVLESVKHAAEGAEATVRKAYEKAEEATKVLEEAVKAVTTARSEAEDLKNIVEAVVDFKSTNAVQPKAQKTMSTSTAANGRLIEAEGLSEDTAKAAQGAFDVMRKITGNVKKAMRLLGGSVPQQVQVLLELAETSQAGFADAASNAASSSLEASNAQISAKNINVHAEQAMDEAEKIKKSGGDNSARRGQTDIYKENVKDYGQLAAAHGKEAVDGAEAAAGNATTAFENTKKAVEAFRQILDAAKNAVTAADEVLKQNATEDAPSFISEGGSDSPLQQNEKAPLTDDSQTAAGADGLSTTESTEATATSVEHTGETSSPASGTPESPLLPSSSAVSAAM
ncbi:hypothetical protein DQ04_22231000, partial [Trypanosoma grayi]|uniref:hypothetical protein n=1 Tax=Trypanosoma grayi TaxID=71804 RepID=UPI0004F402D6